MKYTTSSPRLSKPKSQFLPVSKADKPIGLTSNQQLGFEFATHMGGMNTLHNYAKSIALSALVMVAQLVTAEASDDQAATFEPISEFFQVVSGQLNTLNPQTGAYTKVGDQLASYNAAGFNILDNYAYAWGRSAPFKDQLIRIHADNTFVALGSPTPIGDVAPSLGSFAGDMDYDGNLWIRGNGFQSAALMKINVVSNTYEMVSFAGPNPGSVADLVYQNVDGKGYFYGCLNQDLYIWDVDARVTTKVEVRNLPEGKRVYGAAYTDKNRSLFVSDNKGGVYQVIDYTSDSPRAVHLMASVMTSNNDGFSNPLQDSPIIVPENKAPAITVDESNVVFTESGITIDANVYDEGLPFYGDGVTVSWSKASGPGDIYFSEPTETQTELSFSKDGAYVATLEATDGELNTVVDFQIEVTSGAVQHVATEASEGEAPLNARPENHENTGGTSTDASSNTDDPSDGNGTSDNPDTESNNEAEPDVAADTDTDTGADADADADPNADAVLVATTRAMQVGFTGMPLSSGNEIVYTVTVENTGSDPATSVDIGGMVPMHTAYVTGSLKIDGLVTPAALTTGSTLRIDPISPGVSVVLEYAVTVAAIPSGTTWVESAVMVDYLQSDSSEVSDNDASGHCGILDDGIDHASDADLGTDDDDPTRLPLLESAYYESCTLAFEDLKNAGWNDWDMNDLVLDVTSFYIVNENDEVESVVVTYEVLARGAGMDSQLNLNLSFNGDAQWQRILLDNSGEIDELVAGTDEGTASIHVWSSSKDVLPPYTTLKHKWGAARTERFDEAGVGKAAVISLYLNDPSANPLSGFSESPHDTWIHVPATQQDIHRVEYDISSRQMVYEGPLFGRSMPFAVKLDTSFVWPAEGQPIWLSHPDYIDYVKSGGAANTDWAENYDVWRVWFDRQGMMNGGVYNPVAAHEIYADYIDQWTTQE